MDASAPTVGDGVPFPLGDIPFEPKNAEPAGLKVKKPFGGWNYKSFRAKSEDLEGWLIGIDEGHTPTVERTCVGPEPLVCRMGAPLRHEPTPQTLLAYDDCTVDKITRFYTRFAFKIDGGHLYL